MDSPTKSANDEGEEMRASITAIEDAFCLRSIFPDPYLLIRQAEKPWPLLRWRAGSAIPSPHGGASGPSGEEEEEPG